MTVLPLTSPLNHWLPSEMLDSNYFTTPLYSPHLDPNDCYLFLKLKEFMKGCKCADDEDVICTANG